MNDRRRGAASRQAATDLDEIEDLFGWVLLGSEGDPRLAVLLHHCGMTLDVLPRPVLPPTLHHIPSNGLVEELPPANG
jgi:hypothetical protein